MRVLPSCGPDQVPLLTRDTQGGLKHLHTDFPNTRPEAVSSLLRVSRELECVVKGSWGETLGESVDVTLPDSAVDLRLIEDGVSLGSVEDRPTTGEGCGL